jgi:hypothetical protein
MKGWCISSKGYPRYCSGKNRDKYVHRVKMEEYLGRPLRKDEDVHHKQGNKLDFRISQLEVRDHTMHGWYSAVQFWFMREKDKKERKAWDEYFAEPVQHSNSL